MLPYSTIHHSSCEVLMSADVSRDQCVKCVKYRDTLCKIAHREKQRKPDEVASPSSHTNYRYLQDGEKDQRLQNLHTLYRNTKSKLEPLRVKIAQATSDSGVQLDEQMHTDMMTMVESSSSEVGMYPEGSFQ